MSTGLFDSPVRAAAGAATSTEDVGGYRALSGAAIAAAAVALLSPLVFLGWWLAAVPLLGLVLSGIALADVARRPESLTGRPIALAAACLSAVVLAAGLGWLAVDYAAELPPGHERLSYAALQPLPGDPLDSAPPDARAAHGRDVLLKGYIYPGKEQEGITQFLLVRDQGDCCFGGNPKLTDRVLVRLSNPDGIPFSPRLTKVTGRFRVEPTGTSGITGGVLYHLDDAVVR